MMFKKMAGLLAVAMFAAVGLAATVSSAPKFIFLDPKTSSFWHTATNSTMTVPVDFPDGATSATLAVRGRGYSRDYAGITATEFALALPSPASAEAENVYDLTLSFDNGTVRTAKLGLIQGFGAGNNGSTRCLAPAGDWGWNLVQGGKAVLPIPYGTTAFSVNGIAQDTGLDGAQGWYALGALDVGEHAALSLTADDCEYPAALLGTRGGLLIMFK